MADPDSRFEAFILLQAQNAGLFLGQLPHPSTGKPTVNLRAARTVIDSLEMLEEKSAGNLSDAETRLLDTALDNLRKLYSRVSENHVSPDE